MRHLGELDAAETSSRARRAARSTGIGTSCCALLTSREALDPRDGHDDRAPRNAEECVALGGASSSDRGVRRWSGTREASLVSAVEQYAASACADSRACTTSTMRTTLDGLGETARRKATSTLRPPASPSGSDASPGSVGRGERRRLLGWSRGAARVAGADSERAGVLAGAAARMRTENGAVPSCEPDRLRRRSSRGRPRTRTRHSRSTTPWSTRSRT